MSDFVYQDKPNIATGTVTVDENLHKQASAEDLFISTGEIDTQYRNFASFERGEFDFLKPLYIGTGKIPFSSVEQSDVNGSNSYFKFEVKPTEPYSGGGFTLRTFYTDYKVNITVIDEDGGRGKSFGKTSDEFYPFSFNGLRRAIFTFSDVPPFHFLKIISVEIGGTRILNEADFVAEPRIETNFSLTNEELAFDILSLKVRGDKDNFNFIAGEKITTKDGTEFFVDNATVNNDGTIDVECYDGLSTMDAGFTGILRQNTDVENSEIMSLIFGDIQYRIDSLLVANQKFSGTISPDETRRGALRLLMQGNGLALRRENNEFIIFCQQEAEPTAEFNETNIFGVPDVEVEEKITKIHFSKHNYNEDRSQGLTEAFRDTVDLNSEEKLEYSEPYSGTSVWRDVNGTLVQIPASDTNFEVLQTGAYFKRVKNKTYTDEIVIQGYPYKVSYTAIDLYPNVSRQFRENEVNISNCTVAINGNKSAFREHLGYIYGFNKIVRFNSLLEAHAGDYVSVIFDNYDLEGWIVKKIDYDNETYEYEVRCK